VFLYGFPKSDKANITQDEKKLQFAGKVFLELSAEALSKALQSACYWRCIVSKIIESLRGDLAALHEAGAISKVTMREFDAICPPPVREFSAADIKRLREALKFSQPVFALHLHTSASTVRKWEQGETHPTGPALKLLNVIADKGLQAII
jgi:putative transcriptional regulator